MQYLDLAPLAQAMDAGDALVQHLRVPGEIQVDQHRRTLQVQSRAAGVGGNENLARLVVAEAGPISEPRQLAGLFENAGQLVELG